ICNLPVCPGCRCHYGWTGSLCDQCVTFPGCVYGSCAEPWQCVCDVNWGGLLCDKVEHACLSSPCANGATCDLVSGSTCVCPTGFTGKYCQNGLGPCDSNPCLHGGQCVATEGEMATCDCPLGYSGNSCEIAFDPCNPNPCQQGVQCHSSEGRFMCACPDGYHGNECVSLRNPCVEQDCQGETHVVVFLSSTARQTFRHLARSDLCPLLEGAMSDTTHGGLSLYMILVGILALVTICGCVVCTVVFSYLHRKRKKQQSVPQEEGINNQREFVNLIRNQPKKIDTPLVSSNTGY
uniref:Delta like non-canonical Notch ligand 1 n=1 Tax=Xiphophorus couchianus TaxID=32473 RepID=A0A3B5M0C2_9TELE